MVTCEKDDYIVAKIDNKPMLLKVLDVEATLITCLVDKGLPHVKDKAAVEQESVVANLGKKPCYGNAFKCDIEPYWKTVPEKPLGSIHFFKRIKKVEWAVLLDAVTCAHNWLVENHLDHILPIEIHVRPAKGKDSTTWKTAKDEDSLSILSLRPQEFDDEILGLIFRELASGLYDLVLPSRFKASWIELYHSYVALMAVQNETLEYLLEKTVDQTSIKGIRRDLDENEAPVFDACISYVKSHHNLGPKHIEVLLEQEHSIEDLWPKTTIHLTDMEPNISERALKSPEFFWAEAFRMYATGISLPKKIHQLIEKSISMCKEH